MYCKVRSCFMYFTNSIQHYTEQILLNKDRYLWRESLPIHLFQFPPKFPRISQAYFSDKAGSDGLCDLFLLTFPIFQIVLEEIYTYRYMSHLLNQV